jgi:hypothetical protein
MKDMTFHMIIQFFKTFMQQLKRQHKYENITFNGEIMPTTAEAMFEDGHIACGQF